MVLQCLEEYLEAIVPLFGWPIQSSCTYVGKTTSEKEKDDGKTHVSKTLKILTSAAGRDCLTLLGFDDVSFFQNLAYILDSFRIF